LNYDRTFRLCLLELD